MSCEICVGAHDDLQSKGVRFPVTVILTQPIAKVRLILPSSALKRMISTFLLCARRIQQFERWPIVETRR